jgi:hypothetical protein
MKWQDRVEKTAIALNLIGLGLGFCVLGIFILVKRTIAGGNWIHGILGIVVGLVLLLFAFYFCKHTVLSDSRKTRDFSPAIQAGLAARIASRRSDRGFEINELISKTIHHESAALLRRRDRFVERASLLRKDAN